MLNQAETFSSYSVSDTAEAKKFYSEVLGLAVSEEKNMGLNISLKNGQQVFIYPKGEAHEPANFTVLNFLVEDVEATVDELTKKGVEFEQYDSEWVKTDEKGIARGEQYGPSAMAWFKDPAGNILGVLQQD